MEALKLANPLEKPPRRLILCFDGTALSFRANSSDSNIIKLHNKFDFSSPGQKTYYQPGIGTYTADGSELSYSFRKRIWSSILQMLDQAFAMTFHNHVLAGYRFLMRSYKPGDRIYLFGFSRGAFTARFLARMVSQIGLLCDGNDELAPFAYKIYMDYELGTREDLHDYMHDFKHAFCRFDHPNEAAPDGKGGVKIYFLGLFDTVNSIGIFDFSLKKRLKAPEVYGTAQHIRHAVAIDERRVNFKAALLSQDVKAKDFTLNEDVKEVFFPGSHGDVGGGYLAVDTSMSNVTVQPQGLGSGTRTFMSFWKHTKPSQDLYNHPLQPSDVPLKWMIDEIDQLPEDKISWNKRKDAFLQRYREHSSQVLHSHVHDNLRIGAGSPWHEVALWNILEYLPITKRWELVKGQWERVLFPLNGGGSRDIPNGAVFHRSVLWRLQNDPGYRPKNDVWLPGLRKAVLLKDVCRPTGSSQGNSSAHQAYFVLQDVHNASIQQTEEDDTYKILTTADSSVS